MNILWLSVYSTCCRRLPVTGILGMNRSSYNICENDYQGALPPFPNLILESVLKYISSNCLEPLVY